jgi:hypothetical protein
MNSKLKISAVAGLVAVSLSISQAQPYYVAGSGLTPAWAPGATDNQLLGGPTVYSNTVPTVTTVNGLYHEIKVTGATWSDPNWPANNVRLKPDANGSNTFYFYPGTIVDGWNPIANRIGYADPGNESFEIIGGWDGWVTPLALNNVGNGIFSNSLTVATAGTYAFKFRTPGSWNDIYFGVDFGNNSGDASFTTTTSPQTVPVRLDLPGGRWLIGSLAPPPVTNQVVFAVDMSSQIQAGYFHAGSGYNVYVAGAFNSWPGPGGGVVLVNDPPYNGGSNTNIYYGTNTFIGTPNSLATQYKFNQNDPAAINTGWETSGNRSFNLLSTNGTEILPVVTFSDTFSSDYLGVDTYVTFSVNMNGAHTYAAYSPSNNFDPSSMSVYITGNFDDNGWAPSPWSPPNMRKMTETPTGSGIYSYTHTVLAGHPVDVHYKYGFDDGVNSLDNEAPAYQDHIRVVRLPASGSYTMPTDTFGNQHAEPSFGLLSIVPASGGNVTIQWLGRPGVKLQSNAGLTSGSWNNHDATDGSVWIGITNSTSDGLTTVTNLPAGGSAGFFRLVKPN